MTETHWFFEKQKQLQELIQEKLQELTQAEQEQVLSFIEELEKAGEVL
jgi:formate dehydrogenase maturation protein FdhE